MIVSYCILKIQSAPLSSFLIISFTINLVSLTTKRYGLLAHILHRREPELVQPPRRSFHGSSMLCTGILLQKQSKQRRPRKMNKLEEMIPCLQQLGWEYQPKATGTFVVHCI